MNKLFLLLLLTVLPVVAQNTTEDERYDQEAIEIYKQYTAAATALIPHAGTWSDRTTCNFVSAYESLKPLERYVATRSNALRPHDVTVEAVRKLRNKFAEPLINNLRERVRDKKPIGEGECNIADPDEIGGLLKVDADVYLKAVSDLQKYIQALERENPSLVQRR